MIYSVCQVLDGKQQWIECAGNLLPVIKSEKADKQPYINFRAFKENRLSLNVRVRDLSQEPTATLMFMAEPRSQKGQNPICNLTVTLPSNEIPDKTGSASDMADLQGKLEALKQIECEFVIFMPVCYQQYFFLISSSLTSDPLPVVSIIIIFVQISDILQRFTSSID